MNLRAIKLRGFKSFPEPVEVRLEPGVAVVVGPNGSGKSNVSDAIVWAAGSMAPSELRAEKPDDVIFAGGGGRPAEDFCEVELLFDNPDGEGPLPYTELSVARRLHRGGEGQYLLNRTAVRRIDLVELLADLGLGGGMHSIIGQGRVEEILGSKPEERRELLEEAAGLGRFKKRKHRAELKLARVGIQVERARDVEAEVKKRLRPLALQATAAERAEKLRGEIASLRARVAELDLAELRERLEDGEDRRTAAVLARKHADDKLDSLLEDRRRAEEELADAAGRREQATAMLYRLRSARERLELRRESAQAQLDNLRAELARPRRVLDARVRVERETLREQARVAHERLQTLERALAEREGLPPAARALAEQGERLALSLLDVEPGTERAVAAALGHRAAAIVAGDARSALALAERARAAGLGSVVVLTRDPSALVRELPVVPKEQLLQSQVPAVTREGFAYDPQRGELWFAGETAEAVWLELEARRRALATEVDELEARVAAPIPEDAYTAARDPVTVTLARLAARLVENLDGIADDRFGASLRARADAGSTRTGALAEELRRLGAAEVDARRAAAEAGERLSAVDVERARIEAEADEARRRLEAAAADPAEGDDREELAERIDRLDRRREALGQVNPLAKQEYDTEKERLVELSTQRADLEQSLTELEQLRDDLARTVEGRFAETFAAVQANFAEVASTLFPGGEGRLRLTEPEDEDEQPGIEVELRPAGKRVTRLSLLSGGEKALGAISFLFALFLARPCPFYLLDEVEAALDDTNIGRFVELLRRYSDRAQFIVITHQKRTMEAADILYGVTMGADGVSQIVSRRLPREDAVAVA
ncbi:MAG: chromosome segregation protein SMC [Actinobacteria bacterium]|nr:MAG: chromosome segregation protein SMC [Actinomycetota bacterium]